MEDTPFDTSQTPTQGDNPFASLPTNAQGIPRISIPMQAPSTGPGAQVAQATSTPQPPANVDNAGTGDTINPNMPKYSDDFVDQKGLYGDIQKYAAMPPAQQKQAIEADGLPYDSFQRIMKASSQNPQPGATSTEGAAINAAQGAEVGGYDKDLDDMQRQLTRSQAASDMQLGSWSNIGRAMEMDFIDGVAKPLLAGGAIQGAYEGAQANAIAGRGAASEELYKMGSEFLQDPNKLYIPAEEFFERTGYQPPEPNTYTTNAGHLMWSGIATILGTYAGVSELNAIWKTRGVLGTIPNASYSTAMRLATEKYHAMMISAPATWLASELLGQTGSTILGEKAQDYATAQGAGQAGRMAAGTAGSIAGALAGGTGAFASIKTANGIMRVSRFMLRQMVNLADSVLQGVGINAESNMLPGNVKFIRDTLGIKTPAPHVDPDVLETARAAEKEARDAGNNVVEARKYLDKQIPGTSDHASAQDFMKAMKAIEDQAVQKADSAWNMIPVEVRGKFSRQQSAIRSQFAETAYPKEFAENQVADEQQLIAQQINKTIGNLEPYDRTLGMEGQSEALSDGLWKAWEIAKGAMGKYWARAPLKKPLPDSSILKAMDGLLNTLRQNNFQTTQIPYDFIERVQERFAANQIKSMGKPQVGWVKSMVTDIQEAAAKNYAEGNDQLASNQMKLAGVLQSKVAEAFPDNVPLQQARAFSKSFFDYFTTRSSIGRFMRTNKDRGTNVHPEDVAGQLIKSARGFRDITSLVNWLTKNGAQLNDNKDPMYLTPGNRMALEKLKQDAGQTIRQYVQDFFQRSGEDPKKMQKFLSDPAFNKKISSLGEVSGEVRGAVDEFTQFNERNENIARSALAKYAERDPDKALDMVWGSSNPQAMAKELMDGVPGVGGFRDDPKAMQGFTAGLIDRLVNSTGGDPGEMLTTLAGPRGRLLKYVMGNNAYGRLEQLIQRSNDVALEEAKEGGLRHKFKVAMIRMFALRTWHAIEHHVPFFGRGEGEGASLQQAALVSSFTRDVTEQMMAKLPIQTRLKAAISNPEIETMLYSNAPQSRQEAKDLLMNMHRAINFERSIFGAYQAWVAYGNGPATPENPDPTDSPLWWLGQAITPAKAETTQTGQPYGESAARISAHAPPIPPKRTPTNFRPTGQMPAPFNLADAGPSVASPPIAPLSPFEGYNVSAQQRTNPSQNHPIVNAPFPPIRISPK